ncbi:MAG: CBS domain-containing protein [Nitrosopumilaceae archaeon]|nr:CBS domain-containing protein [Nitrosopumilaceae archaeon]
MSELLDSSITPFINPRLVVAASNLTVTDAAKVMLESRVNSVLVFEDDKVIGIVTNKDFLNDVVAKGLDPTKVRIKEITHSPLITIHKDSTVREALQLMRKHDIRRLIVKDNQRTIGTISQMKIIGNERDQSILLPQLETHDKIKCPYCKSDLDDKETLAKHMEDKHQ